MGFSLRVLVDGQWRVRARSESRVSGRSRILRSPRRSASVCAAWHIPERQALLGYLWAWVENQVTAAIKTVPLGQRAGQRLLAALSRALPGIADAALSCATTKLLLIAHLDLSIASCCTRRSTAGYFGPESTFKE